MKSLAKGNDPAFIFKLIRVLISTQQEDYYEAVQGDTSAIKDIADQVETKMSLYGNNDSTPEERYDTNQSSQKKEPGYMQD